MKTLPTILALLVLVVATVIAPPDTFLGYFLGGFWSAIGTSVAVLAALLWFAD